ncbi:hypothetical protein V501_09327, partial [Pseudogymnoascus sp. VKM F-4519 (FW-2642)]
YRTAHTTHLPSPYVASPRNIYHALHPHPALSPVPDPTDPASIELQSANDAAYRELLARHLLHTLLPPTERDNPALMALVGSILADLVIEKAVERACEPGVIWEGIAKVVEGVAARGKSARRVDRGDDGSTRKGGWQATFWMVIQFAFLAFTAVRALVIAVATSSSSDAGAWDEDVEFPGKTGRTRGAHAMGVRSARAGAVGDAVWAWEGGGSGWGG